jgi:hypothetical protein
MEVDVERRARTPDRRPQAQKGPRKGDRAAPGRARATGLPQFQTLRIDRKNWILFGAGIGCIVVGFGILATGDITIAPILLLLGYLVLIPWALVARPGIRPAPGDAEAKDRSE